LDDASAGNMMSMRNRLLLLVLPSMVLLAPPCMGQVRSPQAAARVATSADQAASAETSRSAFGQVMQVMIDALQQDTQHADTGKVNEVPTTASGTPLGIEVGGAFRLDAAPTAESGRPLAVQNPD
jgi:hypothetical protein